jgi:hypothetical protein
VVGLVACSGRSLASDEETGEETALVIRRVRGVGCPGRRRHCGSRDPGPAAWAHARSCGGVATADQQRT